MHEPKIGRIHLLGLGSGAYQELTLGTVELLHSGLPLFLRTSVHPSVAWLDQQGIAYRSFDKFYEQAANFTELYQEIAAELERAAQEQCELLYAVPGHPLVAERVCELLLERQLSGALEVVVHPAVSAIESIAATLGFDPAAGLIVQDALDYKPVAGELPQLIFQVYNFKVAGELKLTLMDSYDDDAEVTLLRAAGIAEEQRIAKIPLYALDRIDWIDHLTSLFIPGGCKRSASRFALDPLIEIMERLRGPEGCPWDQEQDHLSLRRYCLEEACEVIAAIDNGETDSLIDELGDLLLQIVFHACIGAEEGEFDFGDVVEAICAKMIRRHPHVFATAKVANSAEVLQNWEAIKREERGGARQSQLKGVGDGLPALSKARKLQEEAASLGFDWSSAAEVHKKIIEGMAELEATFVSEKAAEVEVELGELLFHLVDWSRFLKTDPELSLIQSCDKFRQRFLQIEKESLALGKNLISMTLAERNAAWERIKSQSED